MIKALVLKLKDIITIFFSVILIFFIFFCVLLKFNSEGIKFDFESIGLFAARLYMPKTFKIKIPEVIEKNPFACVSNISEEDERERKRRKEKHIINNEIINRDVKKCKITETKFNSSGTQCDNFYVKNNTPKEINFKYYLNKPLDLKIGKKGPAVLIFHTHTTEGYLKKDDKEISEDYYPRTQNNEENVIAVGEEIVRVLKEKGINCVHDKTIHDYPNYNNSYVRSSATVRKNLKKNPSIKIIVDVHRDSLGDFETGKIKPVIECGGQKTAQIMIVSGSGFLNWGKNLSLALKLQKVCEENCKGITRPLSVKKARYNQNLNPGSLLVEVGSDVNTVLEAKRAGAKFAQSLAKIVEKNRR
ncbi:MAG: stage II sporulation protein P [Oscillospiraceae bacterium]|jgi:stage II sporulation protein P|nr:stage II sporulation protein P [Oscillospiraceae bacterium]